MVRNVKGESSNSKVNNNNNNNEGENGDNDQNDGGLERRVLRSRYLAVKSLISDKRDDITKTDSDNFKSIFDQVESLHQLVQKPREQVADAEALLDITNSLMTSVKSQSNEGVSAGDFVSCILKNFGRIGGIDGDEGSTNFVKWKKVGITASHVFMRGDGCCTMLGPMNSEVKQRKAIVQRKHSRPTEKARPEELASSATEEKTDTDKNMAIMFNVLRKHRNVKLECLVLNRNSFAQTVENIFAMSFLIKDGRAEIKVDEKGSHLVLPRNAPNANAVAAKEVLYKHFTFRFDFKDWKLMSESIAEGEELMPHRNPIDAIPCSQREPIEPVPTTPIRKLSRNRGLVIQEQTVVEDSPESSDSGSRGGGIRKRMRKAR